MKKGPRQLALSLGMKPQPPRKRRAAPLLSRVKRRKGDRSIVVVPDIYGDGTGATAVGSRAAGVRKTARTNRRLFGTRVVRHSVSPRLIGRRGKARRGKRRK